MKSHKIKGCVLGALLAGFSYGAHASDYGCKVLLCLANPAGPRAVAQCVPPINQLFRDLARGRVFPRCDMASAPGMTGGHSWAQQNHTYYDTCPAGTSALAEGVYAVQGSSTTVYAGIGEGDHMTPGTGEEYSPLPGKVCVGNRLGDTTISLGFGESASSYPAGIYDRVVMLDPSTSPRVIDVYVDSVLYRRVRW